MKTKNGIKTSNRAEAVKPRQKGKYMTAKKNIEKYAKVQKAEDGCPRCGGKMAERLHTNALSRQIDIMVCDRCGLDEALNDATGRPPLPFEYWEINLKGDNKNS